MRRDFFPPSFFPLRKEKEKQRERGRRKVCSKEMLVIPRLSDELRDASRFVAASHSRNFDHLNADQPVHLCLHSHNSSPVMESTNISIHSRLQQGEAHEGFTKLTLERSERRGGDILMLRRGRRQSFVIPRVIRYHLIISDYSASPFLPSRRLFHCFPPWNRKRERVTLTITHQVSFIFNLYDLDLIIIPSIRDSGIVLNLNYTFVIPNKNLDPGFRKR